MRDLDGGDHTWFQAAAGGTEVVAGGVTTVDMGELPPPWLAPPSLASMFAEAPGVNVDLTSATVVSNSSQVQFTEGWAFVPDRPGLPPAWLSTKVGSCTAIKLGRDIVGGVVLDMLFSYEGMGVASVDVLVAGPEDGWKRGTSVARRTIDCKIQALYVRACSTVIQACTLFSLEALTFLIAILPLPNIHAHTRTYTHTYHCLFRYLELASIR